MKAVRIHEYGGPEVLRYETDVSEPRVTADTVLVKIISTSVNPIDWKIRSGARQKDFPLALPAIPGRDVSGIIVEVGSNIRNFKPGDRVVGMADATYAEFVLVPGEHLTYLPDGIDAIDAAAIPLVCLTGDQLVRLATGAVSGQTIVVTGALGSVGRAAVHAAKKLGATVIAGVRGNQLGDVAQLGLSRAIALDDDAAIAQLEQVDGIADTIGGDTAAKLFGRIREYGRFGYASVFPAKAAQTNPTIRVTRVFARPDAATVQEFAKDIRDGVFALPVTRRMPLSEAAAAHALAQKGGAGKIVLLA